MGIRVAVVWIIFAELMLLTAGAYGADRQQVRPPRVLMLFSNDRLLPANQRYDEGLRRALDPHGNQSAVSFFGEFLDAVRLGGAERGAALEDYLNRRYRGLPPDLLVALGPEALQFLTDRRESVFPAVPLVFGGTSRDELKLIQNLKGAAGLPMELRLTPVVEALLTMRPETREIVLVHGVAEADRQLRDIAVRQLSSLAGRVRVTDFPELPLTELKPRLARLSQDQAVLYLSYFQGPGGETYTPARVAGEVAASASVPAIGTYDTQIGMGVLAVCVSPFEEEGLALGKVIRRVLDGEKPESIGILPGSKTRLIVDARQMERWKIQFVPEGAEIRNRKPTMWEEHRAGVIGAVSVVGLQGLLIMGLIIARRRQLRAETELRASEARFSGIFRGSPVAICILKKSDGRIVDVNPGWEEVTGTRRAEVLGRTPIETGLAISGDAESRFRLFLESGMPLQDFEQLHLTPDGRRRVLSLSTEMITLHDEECYVVVAKDLTEPRAEERERQQLAQTSRLALLGEMTASIAHEINQPLGAILSNTDAAEMLLEQAEPPLGEVRHILEDIRRDDLRASAVINRVRALVGRREARCAPLDLNAVILETLRLVRHDARRRGVILTHELADGIPEVHADAVQIEQIVINFLLNAMDAMKDTPVACRRLILRTFRKGSESVDVSVEDSGHGIPPEKVSCVFDAFFTTKEGGMGLGLSLARSIAEAHGGHLFAENNPSGGSTFHFILPVSHERYRD